MLTKRSLLIAAAMLPLMGFATTASAQEVTKLGLAVANLQADFFNQIKQSVEAYAAEKGIEVVTVDARGDSATQVSQVQDRITQNIDALIYIPAGATAASVPTRTAKAAGIPVINVDRNAADEPGDTFIATDSVNSARQVCEHLFELAGGEGEMIVIHGQRGTTPEVDRTQGCDAALEAYPGITVVGRLWSDGWHQDEGFKLTQDLLQAHPDVSIVWGQADALALGAAQAVRVANLDHRVWVAGFDGDTAALVALKEGVFDVTATQQTQGMGRLAVDSAIKLVAGEEVPAEQLQDATLTTSENVDAFIENHP